MPFYKNCAQFAYKIAEICAFINKFAYKNTHFLANCTVVSTPNLSNRRIPKHVRGDCYVEEFEIKHICKLLKILLCTMPA